MAVLFIETTDQGAPLCPKYNKIEKNRASDNEGKFHSFLCVESEFIVKNQFHNWSSELGCIWHIFGKLGSFWLFMSAPVQAASGCYLISFFKTWLLPVLKYLKRAKISKNVSNSNSDVQL